MDQKKHSACDECRVRKLKCSGQPRGCDRCARDGVTCHYSIQKPMGRPRKRRRAEADSPDDDDYDARPEPVAHIVVTPPATFAQLATSASSPERDTFFSGDFAWMNDEIGKPWDMHFITPPPPSEPVADLFPPVFDLPFGPPNSTGAPWGSNSSHNFGKCLSEFNTLPTVHQPCNCINRFFTSINDLRTPQPPSDLSLTYTLSVSRSAIATCKQSLACKFCLSTFQSGYISNMLLGCLLPLLVVFYQKSLYSIDCTTSPQQITVGENQQVEMEAEPWKMMARSALKKEFGGLMEVVTAMDDRSRLRHPTTEECGNVLVDKREDVPLCKKIIMTIKSIAGTLEIK